VGSGSASSTSNSTRGLSRTAWSSPELALVVDGDGEVELLAEDVAVVAQHVLGGERARDLFEGPFELSDVLDLEESPVGADRELVEDLGGPGPG
jgi:hypothetical protein